MRIRHLVLTNSYAGAEQHVCVLANEQAKHGHVVEVLGGEPTAMRRQLTAEVSYHTCASVAQAVRLCRAARVDIHHAHMTRAESAIALTRLLHRQIASLVTTRHFAAVRGQSRGGRMVRPALQRTFSTQIAVSRYVASRIDGPSRVVYAGVRSQPEPVGTPHRVILVAQRLSPEKRTVEALEVFAASDLARQGWRLEVAGRGPEHEALTEKIRSLGLDERVSLLGFTSDLDRRFRSSPIVLAPAPAEPYGLTVVEAMSHGTAVVATRSGGHLETVGRASSAYLYEPHDIKHAAELLRSLAEQPDLRAAYGRELRSVQQEWFTLERQYEETNQIYEGVLSR